MLRRVLLVTASVLTPRRRRTILHELNPLTRLLLILTCFLLTVAPQHLTLPLVSTVVLLLTTTALLLRLRTEVLYLLLVPALPLSLASLVLVVLGEYWRIPLVWFRALSLTLLTLYLTQLLYPLDILYLCTVLHLPLWLGLTLCLAQRYLPTALRYLVEAFEVSRPRRLREYPQALSTAVASVLALAEHCLPVITLTYTKLLRRRGVLRTLHRWQRRDTVFTVLLSTVLVLNFLTC